MATSLEFVLKFILLILYGFIYVGQVLKAVQDCGTKESCGTKNHDSDYYRGFNLIWITGHSAKGFAQREAKRLCRRSFTKLFDSY